MRVHIHIIVIPISKWTEAFLLLDIFHQKLVIHFQNRRKEGKGGGISKTRLENKILKRTKHVLNNIPCWETKVENFNEKNPWIDEFEERWKWENGGKKLERLWFERMAQICLVLKIEPHKKC